MSIEGVTRRTFLASGAASMVVGGSTVLVAESSEKKGNQRLAVDRLKQFEGLGYGMFIHFGMSTFDGNELSDGKAPATAYAPTKLDVDQWISVARDAGMKYAILTTKHVAGHCLWPSAHTDYTVAQSADKTNLVEKFVEACHKRGLLPGFYYCSWDNHNRFGSKTPSDPGGDTPAFTSSVYQTFQTKQITELLTQFGPIAEMWIDIPGVLGRGYRTFLYHYIAELQPETIIMMNSGISTQETYDVEYAWPSDIIAIERSLPPDGGHQAWRTIEGKEYYIPGEICDPIGKEWFHINDDQPRSTEELAGIYQASRKRGVNLLLNVPPDKNGIIPDRYVHALTELRKATRA
jgi:alpha-L-fucosidase